MWLLNCSNYCLEYNDPDNAGKPYWILSHTWGADEVTFQDMRDLTLAAQKKGFQKIKAMCELASANRQQYVWIDTCCIDKTSSAELSESINSMFGWYRMAQRCVAYLEDLNAGSGLPREHELGRCRWFTRGWTLQELLAPEHVHFYDMGWNYRGTKQELGQTLSSITGIEAFFLSQYGVQFIEGRVATKMSWAAGRQTTRIEDMAYCLLGIFNVQMPLLYGEGHHAFIRLQQTIAATTNDMSLFAWIRPKDEITPSCSSGLLARHPSHFRGCSRIVPIHDPILPAPAWTITNAGIELTTALDRALDPEYTAVTRPRSSGGAVSTKGRRPSMLSLYRLFLHCRISKLGAGVRLDQVQSIDGLAIWLRKTPLGFIRYDPTELVSVRLSAMQFDKPSIIRIALSLTEEHLMGDESLHVQQPSTMGRGDPPNILRVGWDMASCNVKFDFEYHPPHLWNDSGEIHFTRRWLRHRHVHNLAVGLVRVSISNQVGSNPFSRECWVLCGLVSSTNYMAQRPWIELVCPGPDGSFEIFGKHTCSWQEITNAFRLSALVARLQEQNAVPEPESLSTSCVVRCSPTLSLRLRASKFDVAPGYTGFQVHSVTIQGEGFDPRLDSSPAIGLQGSGVYVDPGAIGLAFVRPPRFY